MRIECYGDHKNPKIVYRDMVIKKINGIEYYYCEGCGCTIKIIN